jgi:Outer membrane lipoprotein-sorting protein
MFRAVRCPLSAIGLLAASLAFGQTPEDVQKWLKDVDAARSAFGEAKLRARATQIENGKTLGTADFDIYVKGRDRALIVFRGGQNNGRKALTVGQKMWLIVPGAEHPVPITQNQRLMGGASFADVASLRFAEDFDATLRPGTEKVGDHVCRIIDLSAKKPGAAYPKATLWLDAEGDRLPRKIVFSFSSGMAAREVLFTQFRTVAGHTVVAEMEIRELFGSRTAVVTRLEYLEIAPAKIDDAIFTPDGARAM